MNINTEIKLTYNGISFQRSSNPSIAEREIHTYHEILFCMNANATLFTEKQQSKLQGDVLFLIPKGTYHFFSVENKETFPRLKIYFAADVLEGTPCREILSDMRVIDNINGNILLLLKKLCRIMEEANKDKQGFYAYSAFLMLLSELDQSLGKEHRQETVTVNELDELLKYIAENPSADLSVAALAKRMHASASTVTHLFKKTLGISVHQYVLQRRLVYGQSLILAGNKPSKIYGACGFKDYSSFYKQYKKLFGISPSEKESPQ